MKPRTNYVSTKWKGLTIFRMCLIHIHTNLTHISYSDETCHNIFYLKKIQKACDWHSWRIPWVLLTSVFFYQKSVNFIISSNMDIDCILMHNCILMHLEFFWVFKGFFKKHDCNFDNVSKVGHSRHSYKNIILE